MLCAELIGPESPYTAHDYEGIETDVFRVFDVRDREYGLPRARCFGRYDPKAAVDGVRDAIATLEATGREGVVMKSATGEAMVTYTTETKHHDELAYAFSLSFDCGEEFFVSRVVRDAFQAVEFVKVADATQDSVRYYLDGGTRDE